MIKSMTGFGKKVAESNNKVITTEIRTLNSKQLDIYIKSPSSYREKELNIRDLISKTLLRGKVEVQISITNLGTDGLPEINQISAKHYFQEISGLSTKLNIELNSSELLPILLKMPEVLSTPVEDISPEEWETVYRSIKGAIELVDLYRIEEGQALEKDLKLRIENILNHLNQVQEFEDTRTELIKTRIRSNLNDYLNDFEQDQNRIEQEMIFYVQKLDITEEKIRLQKHCEYFLEILRSENSSGKKLGFICQEIGREINTLGSKANEANIQKLVVLMKDELEKIKEQLANIL